MSKDNPKPITQNAIESMASKQGISVADFHVLSVLWMLEMMETEPDFMEEHGHAFLAKHRDGEETIIVHPFMRRLFSGDLKTVHGEDFGERASRSVGMEHRFLKQNLSRAFNMPTWDEACAELMVIESVIKHCPELQNEAAAIRALIEADKVLGNFCDAVEAA